MDEVVFSFTLSKKQPECIDYAWKIQQVYGPDKPEAVEHLNIAVDVLKKALKQCQKQTLLSYLEMSRKIRRDMMNQRLEAEKAEKPDAVH